MLVDEDPAFGKGDSQMRGLDLKDETLEGDGVVVTHGAFFFDGEDQIKINVSSDWDKSRTWLLGFNGEAAVELGDVSLLQEKISGLFCFDAVQTEFVAESALKGFIDAFTPAACLRGISRNRADPQFCEGPANLSQMSFLDWPACLGSEKEVGSPVGVEGAEDAVDGDAIFEDAHAA